MGIIHQASGIKNIFQKFQWNQPLYLHGLNINFGVGFRDHEKTFSDRGSGLVVVQLNFFRQEINQQVSVLD